MPISGGSVAGRRPRAIATGIKTVTSASTPIIGSEKKNTEVAAGAGDEDAVAAAGRPVGTQARGGVDHLGREVSNHDDVDVFGRFVGDGELDGATICRLEVSRGRRGDGHGGSRLVVASRRVWRVWRGPTEWLENLIQIEQAVFPEVQFDIREINEAKKKEAVNLSRLFFSDLLNAFPYTEIRYRNEGYVTQVY